MMIFDINKDLIVDEEDIDSVKNTELYGLIDNYILPKSFKYQVYCAFENLFLFWDKDIKKKLENNINWLCKSLEKVYEFNTKKELESLKNKTKKSQNKRKKKEIKRAPKIMLKTAKKTVKKAAKRS